MDGGGLYDCQEIMMGITYRESSFLERLGKSFGGVLAGILLLLLSCGLLWWNEGDFVRTQEALAEALAATEELGDVTRVRHDIDGHMVHATGQALANEKVRDRDFGFAVPVLALKRDVEYYQWVEKSEEQTQTLEGGRELVTTTYSYTSEWVDSPVPSTQFNDYQAHTRYKNTVLLNLKSMECYSGAATLGAYRLPQFLLEALPKDELLNVSLSPAGKKSLADRMHTGISSVHV